MKDEQAQTDLLMNLLGNLKATDAIVPIANALFDARLYHFGRTTLFKVILETYRSQVKPLLSWNLLFALQNDIFPLVTDYERCTALLRWAIEKEVEETQLLAIYLLAKCGPDACALLATYINDVIPTDKTWMAISALSDHLVSGCLESSRIPKLLRHADSISRLNLLKLAEFQGLMLTTKERCEIERNAGDEPDVDIRAEALAYVSRLKSVP